MSNAFTNFLGTVGSTFLGGASGDLKDYQHASRLYVENNYARAPKLSFLYFIVFKIHPTVAQIIADTVDPSWAQKHSKEVGLLVKRADLPKFTVATEALNQYNKKTLIQTKISYGNISIDFHDDNSDITNNLWKNYFQYYYTDSRYASKTDNKQTIVEYTDNKFQQDFTTPYGFNPTNKEPFFTGVEIYVLHKGRGDPGRDFTQVSLVNPMVVDWSHDSLNQDEGGKPMTNRMTLAFETVGYKTGKIVKGQSPEGFVPVYYDTAPSPLSVAGGIPGTLFGANGIIAGAEDVFGTLSNPNASPLDYLAAGLKAVNVAKGIGQINKAGLVQEGYSILSGTLRNIATTGNQPGSIGSDVKGIINNGLNIGVKLFTNASASGQTNATPVKTGL
jgi:hypothetical protein